MRAAKSKQSSVMITADSTVLAKLKRVHRERRTRDPISAHMVRAFIATKDHRFLNHGGIAT